MVTRKNNKIDQASLKRDLLNDLDQFLVDENVDFSLRTEEKQKALAELDKLIRQDLSYSQILHTIKKDTQENIQKQEIFTEPKNQADSFSGQKSAHILNLKINAL